MATNDTAPQARNRATLRKYFTKGSRPTEAEFAELIESMLNMQDEGFAKTPDEGLKISSDISQSALLTFYRKEHPDQGLWSVRYGDPGDPGASERKAGGDSVKRNPLAFLPLAMPKSEGGGKRDAANPAKVAPLVALHEVGRVSVGKPSADHMLDVAGMVAARGRVGTLRVPDRVPLLADGKWKDVTETLHDCVALEVVASVSAHGTGHHALLHAVAMNAHNPAFSGLLGWLAQREPFAWIERLFNSRKRIRSQHAWFSDRCDRLELQWVALPAQGDHRPYKLQIRTRCSYQGTPTIDLHVTQLWPKTIDDGAGVDATDQRGAAPTQSAKPATAGASR